MKKSISYVTPNLSVIKVQMEFRILDVSTSLGVNNLSDDQDDNGFFIVH